jgi:PAS domain S-box-containing protein
MSASVLHVDRDAAGWEAMAASLRRAALAVARSSGPTLFADLVSELASSLGVSLAFAVAFDDATKAPRMLAGVLDGHPLAADDAALPASFVQLPRGAAFHHHAHGAAGELGAGWAASGMDSFAAFALNDSDGAPLGQLVAMDRAPMRDADWVEAMLTLFGARMAAEIERAAHDDALRRAALAVSAAQGGGVLVELVVALAGILHVDAAFIAVQEDDRPMALHRVAQVVDGHAGEGMHYTLEGTPCETVMGQRFRAFASDLPVHFPRDPELRKMGAQGYAGFSLLDRHGRSLGIIAVVSRKPLRHLNRVESILQIFAMRAAAEVERLRAEEALRLREEQYRVIFEAASDGFVLRDANMRTLDANPAFYRMYGFAREHIAAGGGYPGHFPREYIEEREAQIRRALEGQETHVETMALRADGSPFWIDLRVVPVRYRGAPHVLQVVRDISALREREQALQRSEARLRATVEAAFDCVIGMDGEGRIVEFNGAAERCFGRHRADVLGQLLADVIIPPRHRDAHTQGLARFLRGDSGSFVGRRVETTAQRGDGSEFPVELAVGVAAVPEGSIFVGHLRDITERRRAEAQRAQLEAQLRQAQKMEALGQLTGGIAHDFNNILTSVIGYVVLAVERAERLDDPRLRHQLAQAHLAAQRARDLIAQMLTFARRGRSEPLERGAIDLAPALRQSLSLLRSTLPSSIELDIDFSAETPAVAADALQIEQVLFNLCINARDAMGGTGSLRVGLRERSFEAVCASCRQPLVGRWVELSVADDGCGLADDVRQRMFDPFYTTKDVGRGSGMGLAMVHGIVHDHLGHVVVDSTPGQGSVFRVLLPPAQSRAGSEVAAPGAAPQPPPGLRGRVLLVEDQAMVGAFMSELLGGWGLAVTLCRHAIDAQHRFAADPDAFDVVITDQTMPRLTGVELAQRLLELRPGLPVLLYTGFDEGLDAVELKRRGVRAVLHKPIEQDLLLAALRDCLERR